MIFGENRTLSLALLVLAALCLFAPAVQADDAIIGTSKDSTDAYGASPNTVFIDADTGYCFFLEDSSDVMYCKTTDGGVNWDAAVTLNRTFNSGSLSVWYDRWTPGDFTGTQIYITFTSIMEDDIDFMWFDTNGDATGTWYEVDDGAAWTSTDCSPSITRSTDGDLFIWYGGNYGGLTSAVTRSTDCGTNWTQLVGISGCESKINMGQILPLLGGDVLLIFNDIDTDDMMSKVWDEDTETWDASWLDIDSMPDHANSRSGWGATTLKGNGDVYLAANTNATEGAAGAILAYRFCEESRSWTTQGTVQDDPDGVVFGTKMLIDNNNGDLYALYLTNDLGSATDIRHKKSTDHGETWGAESAVLNTTETDDFRVLRGNFASMHRLYAIWFDDDTGNPIYGNTIAALTPGSGLSPAIDNNGGATGIGIGTATLNGYLRMTNELPTEVYMYWGTTDGGTNVAAWANTNYYGETGTNSWSTNLTGLAGSTTYYYRLYATNDAGVDWAETNCSFDTPATPTFVDAAADGSDDGTSWANAYTNLQDALDDGGVTAIWVASGTYKPGTLTTDKFIIPANCEVYGGFSGTEMATTERAIDANETILSGDVDGSDDASVGDNALVVSMYADDAVVDGFTIQHGYKTGTSFGSGVQMGANDLIVRNCIIQENYGDYGGAVGTGTTTGKTGLEVINCAIINNTGPAKNSCGIYNRQTMEVVNCTFYGNNEAAGSKPSVQARLNALTLKNCILWDYQNGYSGGGVFVNAGTAIPSYCDARDEALSGTGNFSTDPAFTSGYEIDADSPCFNQGTASGTPSTDISLLTTRPQFVTNDIGCFELATRRHVEATASAGGTVSSIPATTNFPDGASVIFTASYDAGSYEVDHWEDPTGTTVQVSGDTYEIDPISADHKWVKVFYNALGGGVSVTIDTDPGSKDLEFVVNDADYTNTKAFSWANDSVHTVEVAQAVQTPGDGNQYTFTAWTSAGGNPEEYTVPGGAGPYTETASFSVKFGLTMAASPGAGGTVSPGAGPNYYTTDTVVNVSCQPAAHYTFAGWSGADADDLGDTTITNTTITMNTGPKAITATFKKTWFVKTTATGTEDGSSWANACSLTNAMTNAAYGDEIWMSAGTYYPPSATAPLALRDGHAIYGGFAGTEISRDQRDWYVNETIISGDFSGDDQVSDMTDVPLMLGNLGGVASNATLDGIIFEYGKVTSDAWYGSAVGHQKSKQNGAFTIRHCIFRENIGYYGGAVGHNYGASTVENCLFHDNESTAGAYGAGIFLRRGTIKLINCTMDDNTTADSTAADVSTSDDDSSSVGFTIRNCILRSGTSAANFAETPTATAVYFSNINSPAGNYTIADSIDSDPKFVSATDYRLQSDSPCKDTGGTTDAPTNDLRVVDRPFNEIFDMGAYEWFYNVDIWIDDVGVAEGDSGKVDLTFNVYMSGTNTDAVNIYFTSSDDTATVADSDYDLTNGYIVIPVDTTNGTITVKVNGDSTFESTETFYMLLTNVNFGTIIDGSAIGTITNDDIGPHIYVDDNAPGANNGANWADAFTNLWDGINAATTQQVWVAEGTYYPTNDTTRGATFQMVDGVDMYGGFTNGMVWGDRDPLAYDTILSGDIDKNGVLDDNNVYHVVKAEAAMFNGFIVTMGYADGAGQDSNGGGIWSRTNGAVTVRNCEIVENYSSAGGSGVICYDSQFALFEDTVFKSNSAPINVSGVGMYVGQSTGTITGMVRRCTFIKNTTTGTQGWGGGIYVYNSSAIIEDCTFIGNANGYGGGIGTSWFRSPGLIRDCAFIDNVGNAGGGISYSIPFQPMAISNCVFSGNRASTGGGIYSGAEIYASTPSIIDRCTFAGNEANNGGALYNANSHSASTTIRNCSVIGNRATASVGTGGGIRFDRTQRAVVEHITVVGNYAVAYGGGLFGDNATECNIWITNSIFWDNEAGTSGDEVYEGATTAVIDAGYSLFSNGIPAGVTDNGNNTSNNPMFTAGPSDTWSAVGNYNDISGETKLTDSGTNWTVNLYAGDYINPNTSQYLQFYIASNSATEIWVYGDARTNRSAAAIADIGDTYEINDYRPSGGGGALDQGLDIGVTNDLNGELRPYGAAPDMGAFEIQGLLIWIKDASVTEGNAGTADLTFEVFMSESTNVDVNIFFTNLNGTAVDSDGDYDQTNGYIVISSGNTNSSIIVTVNGDTDEEDPDEYMYLLLTNASVGTISDTNGLGTIIDDDIEEIGGGLFAISNGGGATNITSSSAVLDADVLSTGGLPTSVWIHWGTSDGGTNYNSWVNHEAKGTPPTGVVSDEISISADTLYFYRAHASNTSGEAWAPHTDALMARSTPASTWALITVPVQWESLESNKLGNALGLQLAAGLNGVDGRFNGDNVWVQDTNDSTWAQYYLDGSDVWRDAADDPAADVEISLGQGIWIKRNTGGATTIPFSGIKVTNAPGILIRNAQWTIIGWPYATRMENSSPVGWDFKTQGGSQGYNWYHGDNIVGEYNGTHFAIYMRTNSQFYSRSTESAATVGFEAGGAYYYYNRSGSDFTWTAPSD